MSAPSRPALRWYGGKWRLAPWIIGHFPDHRIYVEPFGGAASVLLRKPRAYAEIYNDLDGGVVNLFRVLQDPALAEQLVRALELTPFARVEFELAYQVSDDPVERARRLVVLAFMGFGSSAHSLGDGDALGRSTGFRAASNRSGTTPAHDWRNYPGNLPAVIERLRGVVIEHRDACQVMTAHDDATTLHYVDPPYLPETRSSKLTAGHRYHAYRHDMEADDHPALLDALKALEGMVVLSGYPSALYDAALPGWRRVQKEALADGARKRVEVLWINPAAARALDNSTLFAGAA